MIVVKEKYGHFIGGEDVAPQSGAYIPSINPADKSVVTQISDGNENDVNQAVQVAKAASSDWANMRPLERGKILINMGRALEANLADLAALESQEMGVPLAGAMGALQGAANYYQYYGGLAPSVHGDNIQVGPYQHSYTIYEPYGVIGVITPWNAPLNQAARSIAPALAVGNTIVHKPSEITSATALAFAELAVEAGLPKGVLNIVTGIGPQAGEALVRHPDIAKIAFTGSLRAGTEIGKIAAEKIMPLTLEMGGKSPNIVFADANLQAALPSVLFAFVGNSGQICLAGTRVLIQKSIYEEFSHMLQAAIGGIPLGIDKPFPCLGPLASEAQFEKVMGYFDIAKQDGATLLIGGERASGDNLDQGYYVQPTIYGDVKNNMRIAREEIFGPVAVLIPFEDEDEAIAIANDTEYGLAAGIWTENLSRAHRVGARLQAGQIYVNYYIESSVEHPLGGYKKSGIGREKGTIALTQYAQLKNISIKLAQPPEGWK